MLSQSGGQVFTIAVRGSGRVWSGHPEGAMSINRWLARLSLSFFVIAALLAFRIYKVVGEQPRVTSSERVWLYVIATAMAVALGVMGVRERHKIVRESERD